MTLDASLSSVIIEDNVFDYGNFATDTGILTVPTTYGYGTCIYTTADATITNNYFSGAISGCTPVLTIGAISCNISKNIFIRNSVPINCYINASASSGDQIITENVFDNPTVDGSNETLVQLRTPYPGGPVIIYERNKNQTAFKQIQKSAYLMSTTTAPPINPSERAQYVDNTAAISSYISNPGYYPNTNLNNFGSFKQEGVAINYTTPFRNSSSTKLNQLFVLTNGSTTVGVLSGVVSTTNVSSGTVSGFIVFGNDNQYYSTIITTGANDSIIGMTLGAAYSGTSSIASSAIFFLAASTNSGGITDSTLSTNLSGTFTTVSSNSLITASISQLQALTIGSLMMFDTGASTIYTVTNIDPTGVNITISPSFQETGGIYKATTGSNLSSMNFSINLSEILPENVQIISTLLGVYGNNNVSSLIYAQYSGKLSTDSGGNYQNNLSGITFTVTANSTTVIASATPVGLSVGSCICFSSQSYQVYPITGISVNNITLGIAYSGASSTTATAEYFDNTMADAVHYTVTNSTTVGPGFSPILSIGGTGISKNIFANNTQYLKIDPGDAAFGGYSYLTGVALVRYNLNITINMATPGNLFFPENPLIVKYRW